MDFYTIDFGALGHEVTRELSNYITTLEEIAGRNMDRKNSNDGKRQRTSMHQGRRAQVAVEYKKDWVDPTKQSPSEAWRSNHCD